MSKYKCPTNEELKERAMELQDKAMCPRCGFPGRVRIMLGPDDPGVIIGRPCPCERPDQDRWSDGSLDLEVIREALRRERAASES